MSELLNNVDACHIATDKNDLVLTKGCHSKKLSFAFHQYIVGKTHQLTIRR